MSQEKLDCAMVAKFYHAICVLEEFDCKELRGVVKGMLSLNDRETCYVGTYYRAALNVHSLVRLDDPKHFQAIAQLARALFELAVDMRLLGSVDRATEKMFAFSDLERLKSAREVVSLRGNDGESTLAERFIRDREADITRRKKELWPDVERLTHWSGMDLPTRVAGLREPFNELYKSHYRRHSWYVHSGLAGVLNFEAAAFEAIAAVAFQVAAECYVDVLKAVIAEVQLSKVVENIYKRLDLARMLAFTDSVEEAERLRGALLK